MTVQDLIEELNKMDKEKDVIIKFALDKEDEIGYVLRPFSITQLFDDEVVIYGAYDITKEDCEFIGQVDLKEAYKYNKKSEDKDRVIENTINKINKILHKLESLNIYGSAYGETGRKRCQEVVNNAYDDLFELKKELKGLLEE
ncbi:MAG: hypothetical protein IJV31_10515 [Clostridia bacterium]|nr:hypothetical protein [Clostridia bacterium]